MMLVYYNKRFESFARLRRRQLESTEPGSYNNLTVYGYSIASLATII